MKSKEYKKITADIRRDEARKHGFRQSSYIDFKVYAGYFFCLYFHGNGPDEEVKLTVKPMYADDLWWEIWDAQGNKNAPLSLRGTGAYSLSGQVLASYHIADADDLGNLPTAYGHVFDCALSDIVRFLESNPEADTFYPDESSMDYDPDRLLYLMALIHNGRENIALEVIKDARKDGHECIYHSGLFSDSYTYIRRWCRREHPIIRIGNVFTSIFNDIVRIRSYALMALGRNNKKDSIPNHWDIRLLDGGIMLVLCFSILFLWDNFTLVWIALAVYFIFVYFMDFGKQSERYCLRFGELPYETRRKWKIGVWIFTVSLYISFFALIIFISN